MVREEEKYKKKNIIRKKRDEKISLKQSKIFSEGRLNSPKGQREDKMLEKKKKEEGHRASRRSDRLFKK